MGHQRDKWVLMGHALMGRALIGPLGRAVMGRALMVLPGPCWAMPTRAGPAWAPWALMGLPGPSGPGPSGMGTSGLGLHGPPEP